MKDPKDLKFGFDKMLSAETIIRRKNFTQKNINKNVFISIITRYLETLDKSSFLISEFDLNLSKYEDPFYAMIDDLMLLKWGPDIYKLISFFLYERHNDDGSENFIVGPNMEEIKITTPEELYNIINRLYPNSFN